MIDRLAHAELRHHRAGSRLLWCAMMLSMSVLSYFVFFILGFSRQLIGTSLPAKNFFLQIRSCLLIIALLAFALAFYMLFGAFRLNLDRQTEMLGILDSLGATHAQKLRLLLCQTWLLSRTALPIGLGLGTLLSLIPLPGMQGIRASDLLFIPPLLLLGFLVVCAAAVLPLVFTYRRSAIEALRKNDDPELVRRKSYRRSRTFRQLSLPDQLARKNVDHDRRRFRAIALTLSCTSTVAVVGFLLYHYLLGIQIVVDDNPYDTIDTAAQSLSAVQSVLSLTAALAVLLSLMASFHAVSMIFSMMRNRRREFAALQSIGMDSRQIRRMVTSECGQIGLWAVGWSFLFSAFLSAAFCMIFTTATGAPVLYYPYLPVLVIGVALLLAARALSGAACRYLEQMNVIESIK